MFKAKNNLLPINKKKLLTIYEGSYSLNGEFKFPCDQGPVSGSKFKESGKENTKHATIKNSL